MRVGLLVEDHHDARAWLEQSLNMAFPGIKLASESTLTGGYSSLDHLCEAGVAPDIALVDLGLPDGSGIDLITELNLKVPNCFCVVATRYEDDAHLFAALKAGARGYLLKQQPQAELVRRLEGIANGEPPLSAAVAQRLLLEFGPPRASSAEPILMAGRIAPISLSPREREVLAQLAKGMTLAQAGDLLGVSRHTVAAHVKRIYEKLGVSSRAEASVEAVRLGLIRH